MDKANFEKKDLYERVNYLYQAAHMVMKPNQTLMSQHFGNVLKNIVKRGVLKLDPSVKKTICKQCHAVLIPGVTSTIRLRGKREVHYVITCLRCKTLKRFACRSNYNLWSENREALVEEAATKNQIPKKRAENSTDNKVDDC